MTQNDIITLPHPSLRQRSKRITFVNETILEVVEDMQSATLDWEKHRKHELGVALAAVQINKLIRVIIIRNSTEDKADKSFTVLINPEIVKKEGDPVYEYEGCLSVKDIYGFVPRFPKVKVRALSPTGHEVRITATDFMARTLQHEIDHTEGKLFIDHIKDEPTAFYRLTSEGELEPLNYEQDILKANLFR